MTSYSLYLLPRALKEIDDLPAHVRQQVMKRIYVVGVRKRPPYQYDDLNGLIMQID